MLEARSTYRWRQCLQATMALDFPVLIVKDKSPGQAGLSLCCLTQHAKRIKLMGCDCLQLMLILAQATRLGAVVEAGRYIYSVIAGLAIL